MTFLSARLAPIVLLLIATTVPRSASAEAEALTASRAVSEALAKNPELQALAADVSGAEGELTTARTFRNPELTIEPGAVHTVDAGGSRHGFHGLFSLSQPLEFPGKRALGIALARHDVALREIALEGFRFQLSAAVRRAFYDLLAARKTEGLRREQMVSAEEFLKWARERAERGYASDFESMKGRADLVAAAKALHEAEAAGVEARVSLNALLGREPSANLEVDGALDDLAPPGDATGFRALALARNPSLRARYLEAERAGLQVRATQLGRRPDFAVGPSVEYRADEQIYGIGVSVALPFWDRKRGEIQTATAAGRRAAAEIEKARMEIAGAVTETAERLELARKQLALYTPEFLAALKGFMRQAEEQYAQSTTTLLIYLEARKTYYDTLADYYDALAKVAAVRAELESAVGVPLDSPLAETPGEGAKISK